MVCVVLCSILCCKIVVHLGHTLTADLKDDSDIYRCSRDFVKKANAVLIKIAFCDCFVLTKLPNNNKNIVMHTPAKVQNTTDSYKTIVNGRRVRDRG